MKSLGQRNSHRSTCGSRATADEIDFMVVGTRASSRARSRWRQGYTLFEMLLVLGLIAAFVSMTIPSVMRIYSQEKLSSAAEKIRAGLATARVRAIESGLIYQFCSEVNGAHFVVAPFEPDHLNASGGNAIGNTAAMANRMGRYSGNLPKGMALSSSTGNTTATSSYKVTAVSLDGLPNAGDLAGLNWSIPILFNADGSANMDREIIVSDNHAQRIRIHVRAFTGAATLSRIYLEKR